MFRSGWDMTVELVAMCGGWDLGTSESSPLCSRERSSHVPRAPKSMFSLHVCFSYLTLTRHKSRTACTVFVTARGLETLRHRRHRSVRPLAICWAWYWSGRNMDESLVKVPYLQYADNCVAGRYRSRAPLAEEIARSLSLVVRVPR